MCRRQGPFAGARTLIRMFHCARPSSSVFADAGALLAARIIRWNPSGSEEQQLDKDGPGSADNGDQRGQPGQFCSTDFHESTYSSRKAVPRGTGAKPETAGDHSEEDRQPVDEARWGGQWQGEKGRSLGSIRAAPRGAPVVEGSIANAHDLCVPLTRRRGEARRPA